MKEKIWKESLIRALCLPLSCFVIFAVFIYSIDFAYFHIFAKSLFSNKFALLTVSFIICMNWFLMRWKKHAMQYALAKSKNHESAFDPTQLDAMNKVLTAVIFFVSSLLILDITDHHMTTLIAFGGIGGLVLAFASQEIIANFFGGLMIYLTRPFGIGEWINISSHNIEGQVEEIGWYMTCIRNLEKRPIYIPNAIFSKAILMTPSRMSHTQFKEIINLRYEDLPIVKEIIADLRMILKHNASIDQKLNILVYLTAISRHSIDLIISAYFLTSNSEEYAKVKQDLLFQIAEILNQHGAEFAFPTTQVVWR